MGLFDDLKLIEKKQTQMRVLPPTPNTTWRPPTEFPNLSNAAVLSIDTETYDPELTTNGPGWARGRGHIVGFSVAARDRSGAQGKWYFPLRHEVEREYNLDPAQCLGWLNEQLDTPTIPKVGANLIYDIGWLQEEKVNVTGPLFDVQFAEALLDEQGESSLDFLARKYLKNTKTTDTLYTWLARAYGGKPNGKQRANLYRTSPLLVGPYGEDDAALPLDILDKQWPLLAGEDLLDLFTMENELIPLLVAMRREGVTIDVDAAERLSVSLGEDIKRLYGNLYEMTGLHVAVSKGRDLAKIFDAAGLEYAKTADGNPSFTKEFLNTVTHPVGKLINEIREHEKIKGTFVESYLLDSNINGKIYCTFHPLRSDEGGTKTGRFSSSDPNLQNIPVRTKLGKKIRAAFIMDAGHAHWRKYDYSQIEYRMLAHFAVGPGADDLRGTYIADPKTDYHNRVMLEFARITGRDLSAMTQSERETFRKPIKNVNFGLLYGQTENALALKAGMSQDQARTFFKSYHDTATYVKPTMAHIAQEVQQFGYVRTITGRRTRFNLWEPMEGKRRFPLPYHAALSEYGSDIKRALAYRGVNYKLQGSAADVLKRAMVAAWKSGVFNATGIPRLTVHDELDFSVAEDTPYTQEAFAYLTHLLENSTPLNVPVVVDTGTGPHWGAIA